MKKLRNISKKKRVILMFSVLVIAVIAGFMVMNAGTVVTVEEVTKGQVLFIVKETGSVESQSTITINAKSVGEIGEIAVAEGQEVKAGELLISADAEGSVQMDIKSLEAQAAAVRTQYNEAKRISDKNKILYEEGALSYEAYSQSLAVTNQLSQTLASMNFSTGSMAAATGVGGVFSPIDGVITDVFVKKGESVVAGSKLFEVSNLEELYLKTQLIAEDANKVKVGNKVWLSNEDADFSDMEAKVSKVFLKAQETMSDLGIYQKRVTVEIESDKLSQLRLGTDVDVQIIADIREDVIRVSKNSVFNLASLEFDSSESNDSQMNEIIPNEYVYVIEKGKAALREVKTGLKGESYIEIVSGLEVGERIIKSPTKEIEDGIKVKSN